MRVKLEVVVFKAKEAQIFQSGFFDFSLGIDLLSHKKACSIIGDGELDIRVRNGFAYYLSSKDTKTYLHVAKQQKLLVKLKIEKEVDSKKSKINKTHGLLVSIS